jgi:signal transduction histidine kinase
VGIFAAQVVNDVRAGLMKLSKRITYSRIIFVTGIVLLTSLSVFFVYETRQENTSSNIVSNSNVIHQSLEKIFSFLVERESAFRGFVLTMDSVYLKPRTPLNMMRTDLHRIDSLIGDNGIQQQQFQQLVKYFWSIIQHQDTVASKIGNAKYVRSQAFYADLHTSSVRMDTIGVLIVKMQDIQAERSRNYALEAQKHTLLATMMGVAVSLFSMVIFILAFYFVDQELKRSQIYINKTETLNTKIAEINTELEKANRSLQKLNSELGEKNFQLEKYASELSSFTHITSHDMQEPLRKIEFYISIVEDREKQNLSEDGKKYLEKTKQSVSRMRQLFLSMLDFSLTNTVDNNIEDVDLNEVLQQTFVSLKVYIKDTNANIESDGLPKVKGIRYQLLQLFENILSNAIKFRKPDVIPEIEITSQIIHTKGQTLRGLKNDCKYYKIDFKDNGTGFDPKYADRIFEIFQRLIAKSDSYGVGIGLAISRKIAENHGGTIIANSQLNVGSVFSLYIPVT